MAPGRAWGVTFRPDTARQTSHRGRNRLCAVKAVVIWPERKHESVIRM
jgi:hypothetical protein